MPYKDLVKRKEYQRKWAKARYLRSKKKVVDLLGGKCKKCGIKDIRVLEIDHIEPVLRKKWGGSGTALVVRIEAELEPLHKFQLLCANCHSIKTIEEDFDKYLNNNKYSQVV
jgi:5-methylcytosine-specific restriction endonuclease McrA